jgi:hypothetical protein
MEYLHGSLDVDLLVLYKRAKWCRTFLELSALDGRQPELGESKIWEVARATSAASFYFPTALIKGVNFWEGGLANNIPIDEVWIQRGYLFQTNL